MKRMIAVLLSAVMLLSPLCVQADDTQMYEDIIDKARICFDLPEDIEDIEMSGSKNSYYTDAYTVKWNKGDSERYEVSADEHGCITSFYANALDEDEDGEYISVENKITKEQAVKKTDAVIKELYGENVKYLSLSRTSVDSSSISVYYVPMFNGLELEDESVSFTVERRHGGITSFDGLCTDIFGYNYTAPSEVKLLDDAKRLEVYKKNNDLKLVYRVFTDNDTKEENVRPVYLFTAADIDAVTGERIRDKVQYKYSDEYAAADSISVDQEEAAVAEKRVTENEYKAIDKYNTYIKENEADALVKKYFPKLTMKLESSRTYISDDIPYTKLSYSYSTDKPYRYKSADALINAITGEIINYYYYDSEEQDFIDLKTQELIFLDKDKAEKTAREWFKKLAPKEYESGEFVVSVENCNNQVVFSRVKNGAKVEKEGVTVTLNTKYELSSYNKTWEEHDFPSDTNFKKDMDIYKAASEDCELKYMLETDDNGREYPLLVFGDSSSSRCYDALTGERLNPYSGEIYVESPEYNGEYTDIDNSPYKIAIQTLADYGYVLPYSKFEPEKEITIDEFYKLIGTTPTYTDTDKKHISYYYGTTPLFSEAEAKQPMTKYDMTAVLLDLCSSGYYTKIAKTDIFKTSFDDVSEKYTGTVQIASAIGIIPEKQGKFNGEEKITRGRAAQYLYECLLALKAL